MKTKLHGRHLFALLASTTLLLGMYPATSVQAATTGFISPGNANGFYTQWDTTQPNVTVDEPSYVNNGIGCVANDSTFWVSSISGQRSSAIISIPGTVPNGATIDSVAVQVCQGRSTAGVDGATFQTFVRASGAAPANLDSGTNIVAATPAASPVANTQTIPVGIVKSGATTLQVGVLKTNTGVAGSALVQRIYTLAANISFTLPSSTTTVSCTTPIAIDSTSSCTATVAPTAGGNTPTGAVIWSTSDGGSFSDQSCTLGTGAQTCTATFTPSALGSPTVTATYVGDSNMTGSAGNTLVVVTKIASTTTVSCDSPIIIGSTSLCTATVSPPGATGIVNWTTSDGGSFGALSCSITAPLICSATFTPSVVGSPTVTATYAGDSRVDGSTGNTVVVVNKMTSTTTVSCDSPIIIGGTSLCTATVSPPGATGIVNWTTSDGGSFGAPSCSITAPLICSATFTPSGIGEPTVTATYAGDSRVNGSTGTGSVLVQVPPPATPVPVFGPLGLLLTMLGVGLVGAWQSRRKG